MSDLKAGRELDALVAEKVMGWVLVDAIIRQSMGLVLGPKEFIETKIIALTPPGKKEVESVPNYSTDIAAAWEIVLEYQNRSLRFQLVPLANEEGEPGWQVEILKFEPTNEFTPWVETAGFAQANTAPLAICLAALKALGHE